VSNRPNPRRRRRRPVEIPDVVIGDAPRDPSHAARFAAADVTAACHAAGCTCAQLDVVVNTLAPGVHQAAVCHDDGCPVLGEATIRRRRGRATTN
jgi:hypothetical protein